MGMMNRRQIALAGLLALGLGGGMVHAATPVSSTGNNFTMLDPENGPVGGNNTTAFTWDGTYKIASNGTANATLVSTTKFFSFTWSAHNVEIFAEGEYTFDTAVGGGNLESGMVTLTVGPGQVGAHMLFDWSGNNNIDVCVLWDRNLAWTDASGTYGDDLGDLNLLVPGSNTPTTVFSLVSVDGNGDGVNGIPMAVDGPFQTFDASFNIKDIVVPGSTRPVITVTGSDPEILTVGDPAYVDAGATANDTEDGNITADIVVGGDTVDTNVANPDPGYIITYNVTDSTGLPAAQKTRTVYVNDVVDLTPPVITLLGANPLEIELHGSYTDPGFTATDNLDGNVHGSVVVAGDTVDPDTPGDYVVTYNVTDVAGNPAIERTRTVTVLDTDLIPPVLTLTGANPITVVQGATYTDPGYTATDARDGNLHADVVISGDTVDTDVVGKYVLIYNVADAAGNPAPEKTRIVNVVEPECVVGGGVINNFTMYDDEGLPFGGSNTVEFTWVMTSGPNQDGLLDGSALDNGVEIDPTGNATFSTTCKFFSFEWFATPVYMYGPGTYVFDTCPAGSEAGGTDGSTNCTPGNDAANLITMVVGEGQVGAHMLFEWNNNSKIDMINVFDASHVAYGQMSTNCGGADANRVWDLASMHIDPATGVAGGAGTPGRPFVDGPFVGKSGNMNVLLPTNTAVTLPQQDPVLEIQGDNPLLLATDATFTCPRGNAVDLIDGEICDKVTRNLCSNVNTSVPGAYTVNYQVVDSESNKVSEDLLVIVFGDPAAVPTQEGILGHNPLVAFGATEDHPVIVMNPELLLDAKGKYDANGEPKVILHDNIDINVTLGDDCIDPGFAAYDPQDGVLGADSMTTVSTVDCSKPGHYTITYTATDSGDQAPAGMAAAAAEDSLVTTVTRAFNVNAIPTADEQLPAEQSENADVGGGCSAGNGPMNPLQRADLLLVGGFLAVLGLRRVKRSDV